MTWCDKLASMPTAGLVFDHHFASSSQILDAIAPILDKLVENKKPTFSIGRQEAFGFDITTDDGFQYGFNSSALSVGFVHRLKLKNQSGAYPTTEMISKPQPFSNLLPEVCRRLLEVATLLIDAKTRQLKQIGIVTMTYVDEDEAPPGILKFIKAVSKPWQGKLDSYSFEVVAKLNPDNNDRCIHEITKPEDVNDGLTTLKFDWQRQFSNEILSPTKNRLSELLDFARKDAINYFEELAEGNRFDG